MKKCFELTPCLLAFLCITSCIEDVDNERSKGMFSASQSGFSTIEVYDLGPLNKIDLSIAKAGLEDTGGTVTFSVEQSLLDSLNNADGTSYQLLPPECYTIEKWQGGEVAPPYEIILDMGKENSVSQLGLIARQNALTSMNLEIYAGDDGETWNLIGKYFFDGSIKTEQMVPVKACDARWIRIYIPTLGSGSSVGHLAEIYVYGTDK